VLVLPKTGDLLLKRNNLKRLDNSKLIRIFE